MILGKVAAAVLCAALPLGGAAWLVRRVRRDRSVSLRLTALLAALGGAAGAGTFFVERAVLGFAELSVDASRGTGASTLLALLLFAAPLEEAAKVLIVWPTVYTRRLDGPGLGVVLAVCVASGFAAAETVLYLCTGSFDSLRVVRGVAGLFAHLFWAGVWGYALGARVRSGGHWFGPAWVFAVAIHALYDHIVFGRGPGLLVIALPMLAAMGIVAWSALRDLAPTASGRRLPLPLHLPEPPSLRTVRHALRRTERPLMFRWILFGAVVNVGAVLMSVGAAAVLARRLGIDLSVADEADMRSNGPLVLLGAAVLLAFPLSGYLIARASGTHGVLEPAFAAALAILGAVLLLSVTAPPAVIFALAVAPVAFGLACGGAWFGLDS
ncbi:MAG TPA: PrsW family glutamic-type intramembrane protease [Polyangiaceae bacterium]